MHLYRIAKTSKRTSDISGTGAYKTGGRWNNPGTYMLYTSENSSLAYLENLVHFEADIIPPSLFIMVLELEADPSMIYTLPDKDYPKNWQQIGNLENRVLGSKLMEDEKYLAVKVRSAVNTKEYNYLLNPLFPGYHDLIKVVSIERLPVDNRLIKIAVKQ